MISVIDIGSNTIRASVYERNGEQLVEVENFGEKSTIFEHTENGILTPCGIAELTQTLLKLTSSLKNTPAAFATAAFRDLKNGGEVRAYIKKETGIDVELLSGETEAECDYLSLKSKIGSCSGIGLDLGGGSCQIFAFDKDGVSESISLPLGVKRLKRELVSGIIPTDEEREIIYNYVKTRIKTSKSANTLYIMGGTARAILKLALAVVGKKEAMITQDELKSLADFSLDESFLPIVKAVVKKRFDTVGIGAVVISAIAEKVASQRIEIVDCSVREGYIIRNQLKNP
ncbi:MAG: hypothetical protein IJ366_07460 [Clostridia bacterium]|nr:hypothetical protein [Clostridia bacterium]